MGKNKKRVVIIGGGITGLTAAFYIKKAINEQNLPIELLLIEASHSLGGKIQTEYRNDYVIEKGPDSFLERKTSAYELVKDVGLEKELVNNTAGKAYIYVKDQMHPLPTGAVMGIPTKLGPFLASNLFSIQGKISAISDLILPRSKPKDDQSIGSFLRRRLGEEVVENLVEPLLSGIYAGDIDRLSLMSTFPQFYHVEQQYRSLIKGMKKVAIHPREDQLTNHNQGVFLTLRTGLQSLVEAIETELTDQIVQKGKVVTSIKHSFSEGYEIEVNHNQIVQADSIVLTIPHYTLPELFPDKNYMLQLKDIPATTVATIAIAFDENDIGQLLDGTGFVVSRHSDYTITACTLTYKKWPHTTPKGKVLLRCYIGRAGEETVVELSDMEIEQIVLDDLKRTMNIQAKPEFTIITRWVNAMPQYTVNHQKRMDEIENKLKSDFPGIFLAGSSYHGLGLPDCITQGKEIVQQVLQFIEEK